MNSNFKEISIQLKNFDNMSLMRAMMEINFTHLSNHERHAHTFIHLTEKSKTDFIKPKAKKKKE